MVDPISLAFGGLASGFVGAIGPRLVQQIMPTPFDRAQTISIEVQRQRLVDEEKRFERQTAEARERLLIELQHRQDMIALQEQLRRWEFDFLPSAFIQASAVAGGRSLNIILHMSNHRRIKHENIDHSAIMLKEAVFFAEEQMVSLYTADRIFPQNYADTSQNTVLFYPSSNLDKELPIQSTVTTLASVLASEPVILVDIAIRDGFSYRVTIAHWGDAMGTAPQPVILPPQTINLVPFMSDIKRASSILSLTLTGLLVALSDNFHLLRHMGAMPTPAMPSLINSVNGTADASVDWKALCRVYGHTLDMLADRSPIIATDIAAKLALATHAANEDELAKDMLGYAVRIYAKSYRQPDNPQQVIDRLASTSLGTEQKALLDALHIVGGLEAKPAAPVRSKHDTYMLLTGAAVSHEGTLDA